MKGLILSSITGLIIASIGCSYASAIRISAVNESATKTNLIISSSSAQRQVIALGSADATLRTADYTYPTPILIQSGNNFPKPCNWTSPPAGKQIARLRSINLTISTDKSTNSPICLIDWS